jgi:hypothetical protein
MDKDFVDHHKLPLVTKKHPIPIDGRPLISEDVTHETILLDIVIEGHHSIIAFNVIKSPSNPVVLGLSWLDKNNPTIDWKTRRLTFQPNIASIQESNCGKISSVPSHQQLKSHYGEISKTQVPLVVGAKAFIQAAKKRTIFYIYATSITESAKAPKALPTRYKEY